MKESQLFDFAQRYTAAWCSQDAASVASFFAMSGSLTINENTPAVGRIAISQVAQSFMIAFPDLCVAMDRVTTKGDGAEYYWTLTGTNSGPGGTGRRVCISGYEVWQFDGEGLIALSKGHFDATEYQRQLDEADRAI